MASIIDNKEKEFLELLELIGFIISIIEIVLSILFAIKMNSLCLGIMMSVCIPYFSWCFFCMFYKIIKKINNKRKYYIKNKQEKSELEPIMNKWINEWKDNQWWDDYNKTLRDLDSSSHEED